ncbi:DUF1876 domain-containing protein [Streptomyces sp. HNM0574]|uniref:DUF1876 domain-containing protein n=1 Tax=Streptomyces sp. HNM0574 TaxID=2714954 RepID=UPI001469F1CC|nr:DUF1876 domain-containing protein [Streptomyces sp. HNM0574]NLU70845.1 DUF1876 domain-containing protein [Streptomyces sp. HNM0574]
MQTIVGWHIEMEFQEIGHRTECAAMVRLQDGTEMRARGEAIRHPDDQEQPRVGEELAAARCLNDLAHQLMNKAGSEIEEVTHLKAHLAL